MRSISLCVLSATLLTSCAMAPAHVEEDFGRSVRQMVQGQISEPEVAANPPSSHPDSLDGVGAAESLAGYRKGAGREGDAPREIRLSVD